jgi:S-formylglutathione hydrolase FrmB
MRQTSIILIFFLAFQLSVKAYKQHVLTSKNIAKADTVWVFTPSTYDENPAKKYPMVYLLHGWSGNYHQWNDIMDCQAYSDRYGFILVCPDGLYDSWYINSPAKEQSQFATFFFSDLMPFVEKNYRQDPENIFITGLSMGGHGALYLFASKPELFRSAGSLSGVLDLTDWLDSYSIKDYLGITGKKTGSDRLKAFSVTGNIKSIAESGKEIIISCGSADEFLGINNDFKTKCDDAKIKATYITGPGKHDYSYWESAIGYQFIFFENMVSYKK